MYKNLDSKKETFESITIDSIEKLRCFISEQKTWTPPKVQLPWLEKLGLSSEDFEEKRENYFIYRGIRESKFELNTSLQFHWKEIEHFYPNISQLDYLKSVVGLLKKNSIVQNYEQKKKTSFPKIGIIALMQHYGVPTPFLDWTPDIKIGLNFAHDGMIDGIADNEISNYVSLYYINLKRNFELTMASYQNILNDATGRIESMLDDCPPNTDKTNASLDNMFSMDDLGIDFIFVDDPEDAPEVKDIFKGVLDLINPNLAIQKGAFIMNFHPEDKDKYLDYYWNEKLSENSNHRGIMPRTKIQCANIKKSVLQEWFDNGGEVKHYDDSEESQNLKKVVLETYYGWLLKGKKDFDYFKACFVKNGETEDQKIAKAFLENFIKTN